MKPTTGTDADNDDEAIVMAEAQLLLAEKRTSLSTMRTGIALCALPLSIVSVLIATSSMYDVTTTGHLLVPLLVACALLLGLGLYLIFRAMFRMRRYDHLLHRLRGRNARVSQLIE